MRKGLTNRKDISPSCKLCGHGVLSPDGESVLCIKTGIRLPDSNCRNFKYDPLKRVPLRPIKSGEFSEEDFSL